ncbi:MAG: TonB family protein [Betaproteobacteria bacterium]
MEFVLKRSNPGGNITGLAVVVALHVVIAIGFMNALVRPMITPAPPTTYVTPLNPEPPKPREPLPRIDVNPVPRLYVPAIVPQPPPVIDTTIISTMSDPVMPMTTPGTQVAVLQPGITEKTAPSSSVGIACPNSQSVRSNMRYPPQARRDGLQGDVVARFLVAANGDIRNINITSSSNRAFNSAVVSAVGQFSCVGQGRDVVVEVPFSFRLE